MNGHEESCPDAIKAAQDAKTSKPTTKAVFLILDIQLKKKSKNQEPYLILEVVAPDNTQGKLYVWHKSMHEYLVSAKDKNLLCQISQQEKDGKTYHQLEHILELAGVPYVDGKPAQAAEMPATQEEPF